MPHKLLLADDSITIQRVIELTFADEDVHVRAVGDGKSAIASIQAERPDIVLADVGMPERDGYDLIGQLRNHPAWNALPAIALTAFAMADDRIQAVRSGYQAHLGKPVMPADLLDTVAILLDR